MDERSHYFRFALQRSKPEHVGAVHDPSHRFVSSGVNSVRSANSGAHGRSDMAAISDLNHLLVTCRKPVAGVAFGGKFWSMQNDCGRHPFGFFFGLAALPFFKA
jgi:hypothetical protein